MTGTVALDSVEFEVFRFVDGANPLDPTSTPPLKTFFIDSPGSVTAGDLNECTGGGNNCDLPDTGHAYCVLWDGSQNIQGGTGKINGQYGFRVTVQTNQVGQSGNITITQTRAYPSGATLDSTGAAVASKNITVDVTDVHVVRSTPTVVGQITGVSAEPYNFTYRLSKDSTMYITVYQSASSVPVFPALRHRAPGTAAHRRGLPRHPERDAARQRRLLGRPRQFRQYPAARQLSGGVPGEFVGPIRRLARVRTAPVPDDLSDPVVTQIALDPLQITDIRVQPLLGGSTSLAVLSYQLTEQATVYVDVYPPGTQFCLDGSGNPALEDVNNPVTDNPVGFPAKNFSASLDGCVTKTVAPLRSVVQQQTGRASVLSFWDGRDVNGNLVGDGDYVFVLYAALPSQAGVAYNSSASDKRVWTSLGKSGFIPVLRGLVGITQVTPTSTIIGSSPAISGLNPFTFRYQLTRDAIVSMKIFNADGSQLIKTLVNNEVRPGLFNNSESWIDGNDDNGLAVASGTYLVQLTATDGAFPTNVSTTTALFPLDDFRITDVSLVPLLSGASDQVTLTYQLSQPMFVAWNIYPGGLGDRQQHRLLAAVRGHE